MPEDMEPPNFAQRVGSIAKYTLWLPKFHLHKGYLAQILNFSTREGIDNLLLCVENGGSGSKYYGPWSENPKPYNIRVDLKDNSVDSLLGLHYQLCSN